MNEVNFHDHDTSDVNRWSLWKDCYDIRDADGETVLSMVGPCCILECPCFDLDFDVSRNNTVCRIVALRFIKCTHLFGSNSE